MTLYIGVDIHARQQTVSYLDTEDGTMGQQELHHERDDVRAFYSQFRAEVIVGIEGCGYTNWFEELMEELGHKLLVGDAAEIRRLARRRQKNDRRDADLLLELLVHHEFPALFRYPPESRELLRQLRYRHKLVKLICRPCRTLNIAVPLVPRYLGSTSLASPLFSFIQQRFTPTSFPQLDHSNSKYLLTRLSPTQNCVAASSSLDLLSPPRPTLILNTLDVRRCALYRSQGLTSQYLDRFFSFLICTDVQILCVHLLASMLYIRPLSK